MSLFQEVLKDPKGVEKRLMGPSYPYYKYIKSPGEMGMSDKGTLDTLGNDINGLISYSEVLVTGKSNASATGQALGNKFFLKTGGKCKDTATKKEVDRYIYIDHVPSGNVPFISSGMGVSFSEFEGLIPGAISNLDVLNPFNIMQAFMSGSTPDCQELTMETIDTYNNKSTESNFVTLIDIKNIAPCTFQDKINTVTGVKCTEGMNTMSVDESNNISSQEKNQFYKVPNDIISKTYFASIGIIGVYILYCMMMKTHKK